jgi:hypothetical protein
MLPSLDSLSSACTKEQFELLMELLKVDAVTQQSVRERLGLNDPNIVAMLTERDYEEKREHLISLCLNEGTDMKLHNDCVTELLMYMDGGHPAFGNVVGEMCMMCEAEGQTPMSAAIRIMNRCPEYRKPQRAGGGGEVWE